MKKRCTKGIWDETVPAIKFDKNGISNYYYLQKNLEDYFPRNEESKQMWNKIVENIKKHRGNKKYDCVIGVSGGVDSTYLLHLAKKVYGLNPLAVNLDNGWNSDIAVKNIHKITQKLDIDLETYVINYEEIKDLLRSYMFASLPWIDAPTDIAIKGSLYKVANKEGIKYIFSGNDFRSEGKQPREWTYSDHRQLNYVHKKFGSGKKLKTYPYLSLFNLLYYGYFKKVKTIRPYYYLEYQKQEAKKLLIQEYAWEDYGGHHHENVFTKFAMAYWLPKKFNIDKRIINLSAQVVSNAITRAEALQQIEKPFETEENLQKLKEYTLKKLDISSDEFETIMNLPNKFFYDYPNDFSVINKFINFLQPFTRLVYKQKPMSFFEMELRE